MAKSELNVLTNNVPNTSKRVRANSNQEFQIELNKINLIGELRCPVCTELSTNPRECHTCGHLFCAACIAHLKFCPLCRMGTFITCESRFAHRLLDQIQVKCVHCASLVVRAQLVEHERTCAALGRSPAAPNFQAPDSLVTIKSEAVDFTQKEHKDEMKNKLHQDVQQTSIIARGKPALLPVGTGITQLRLSTTNLQGTDNWSFSVSSMCALSNDDVLISSYEKGLRTLSLQSGQLSPVIPCALKRVLIMALDTRTYSLVLVVRPPHPNDLYWWLVSMRRRVNEMVWDEVERLDTEIPVSTHIQDIGLCESRVLLGTQSYSYLHAFDVSTEHNLCVVGIVLVNSSFVHFACTRVGADTLVAFSHKKSVSLQRLVGLELEPLAEIASTRLKWLLFRGTLLLATGWNNGKNQGIQSFHILGGGLNLQPQVLLDFNVGVEVSCWCIAGNRLIMRANTAKDLLTIYDLE